MAKQLDVDMVHIKVAQLIWAAF